MTASISRSMTTASNRAATGGVGRGELGRARRRRWRSARPRTRRSRLTGARGDRAGGTSSRSIARSSVGARSGCSTRAVAASGVARRTASGCRGGDALVMSGSSSGIGRAEQRQLGAASGGAGDAGVAGPGRRRSRSRSGPASDDAHDGGGPSPRRRAPDRRAGSSRAASRAERQLGNGLRAGEASEKSYPQLRQRSTCSNPR